MPKVPYMYTHHASYHDGSIQPSRSPCPIGCQHVNFYSSQSTTMARTGLTVFALFAILIAVYFEFSLKARLSSFGVWRKVEPVGNTNCNKVETLQACESVSWPNVNVSSRLTSTHFLRSAEIVLHPPSGLLYLACATPAKRRHWLPALEVLQDDKVSFDDYIATYDSATGAVTRLTFSGFPTSQGYSSHGLDVVPSAANPRELFVYAINHRKPVNGQGKVVGADSVVEIFKITVGGNTLTHVRTIESPIIDTPNDLVGSSDGRSFYFTNDHGVKVGFVRRPSYSGKCRIFIFPRLDCSSSWG